MANYKQFKKGDTGYYIRDYSNTCSKNSISGNDFKTIIEDNFPELFAPLEKTNGYNTKSTLFVPTIYQKPSKTKKLSEHLSNKGWICIKEATSEKHGTIVGIHDFQNFIVQVEFVNKDEETTN